MRVVGWTQAETARRLGLTSGAVNQFVKGTSRPSPITLRLMAVLVFLTKPEVMQQEAALSRRLAEMQVLIARQVPEPPPRPDWENRVIAMLAPLVEADREKVLTALEAIMQCLKPKVEEGERITPQDRPKERVEEAQVCNMMTH